MEDKNNKPASAKSTLIKFPTLVLVLMFVAPLLIALVIYINWNNIYFAENNKGIRVSPQFNIQLQSHFDMQDTLINIDPQIKNWNIVYLSPKKCDKYCQQRKANLIAMYKHLKSKYNNVSLIATPSQLVKIKNHSRYQALLIRDNNLIITDPEDKVVMCYESHTSTARILKDLRQLIVNNTKDIAKK